MSQSITDAKMRNLLKRFVASDGTTLEGVDASDLASYEIKNYFSQDSVLKLFKRSTKKQTNNKPYTFDKRLSKEQVEKIVSKLDELRREDDLFIDGIHEAMEV